MWSKWIVVKMKRKANVVQIRLAQPGMQPPSSRTMPTTNNRTEEVHRRCQWQVWPNLLGRVGVGGMSSHDVHVNVLSTDFVQTKSSASIENVFPEVLRDPILRKVQFATISRMDELGKSRMAHDSATMLTQSSQCGVRRIQARLLSRRGSACCSR